MDEVKQRNALRLHKQALTHLLALAEKRRKQAAKNLLVCRGKQSRRFRRPMHIFPRINETMEFVDNGHPVINLTKNENSQTIPKKKKRKQNS